MSTATTRPFFDAHTALRRRVERLPADAHDLGELDVDGRIELIEGTVAFLSELLMPYAHAEESVLYPGAARLLGEPDASYTVAWDRAHLRKRILELTGADPSDTGRLQELHYAIYAMLTFHLQREEELYLRLLSADEQDGVHELLDEVVRDGAPAVRRFAR